MSYTYTYLNPENTSLKREDDSGKVIGFPADPANRHYAMFLASGATAEPYVAPAEPEPLTAQQKLENAGLTVDELKTLLGI